MKRNKGISLIVLIITIIVIIILATAILVSVISNNPISEANKARYESDRDNMQAVFTNTVGKIMAENQGVVNVTAGQINTEVSGVSETTGTVAYTVNNASNEANASGTIIFDKGTNDATTYYTGKKLPIYAAGETKWYVDSDGVISLEVAGVKYGSGEIESGSEEEESLEAGLYAEDGTMTKTWDELITSGDIVVSDTVLTNATFTNYAQEKSNFVISDNITTIDLYSFMSGNGTTIVSITIPDSITTIEEYAFYSCDNLKTINYSGTQQQWNAITFGDSWNADCPEITVHCTDGDITIPAN